MSAPKLPKPLPYKVVDDWINANFYFTVGDEPEDMYGSLVTLYWADPRNGSQFNRSFEQQMIDLKFDVYGSSDFEDEYIEWSGGGDAMVWRADWTEEDTDKWIDYHFAAEPDLIEYELPTREERHGEVPVVS